MKTIKTWFKKLEEPYRTQAIINTTQSLLSVKVGLLSDALGGAFGWERTKEGYDYWNKLNEKLLNENR